MKKIVKYFMMVIALCIFALTANSFSIAEASALYTPASYWNNDTNYPFLLINMNFFIKDLEYLQK